MNDKLKKFLEYWYARVKNGTNGQLTPHEIQMLQYYSEWLVERGHLKPAPLGVSVGDGAAVDDKVR